MNFRQCNGFTSPCRISAAIGRVDVCSTYRDINLETACAVLTILGRLECVRVFWEHCDNLPTLFVLADLSSCSRALQYALKHPLVVPDTGAPSHSAGYTRDYLKRKVSIVVPLSPAAIMT